MVVNCCCSKNDNSANECDGRKFPGRKIIISQMMRKVDQLIVDLQNLSGTYVFSVIRSYSTCDISVITQNTIHLIHTIGNEGPNNLFSPFLPTFG